MSEHADPATLHLLRHLVEQATEHAFLLVTPEGRISWCNSGGERIFAVTRQAIVGRAFRDIFTEEDKQAGIDWLEMKIASEHAISEDDRWHVRADGSRFWSSGALIALFDAGQLIGFGKIIRDRTDLKTQLDALGNQVADLQSADEAKDRAITTLVHELRNVVAGLRGTVALLDTPLDDATKRQKFTGLMTQQLEIVQRLTDDLLDLKRAEAHKVQLELQPLDLQYELRLIVGKIESRLIANELTLHFLAPAVKVIVNADHVRLQQIFMNLLDNAIKYTPRKGQVWIKITTEDQWAVVHVEDSGRGIPSTMLQKIFELFTQVDPAASVGGLGVGLALVRELVTLHGGFVHASSKGLNQGSELSVRLPLVSATTPSVIASNEGRFERGGSQ